MVQVIPFAGLHYAENTICPTLFAPPYDVISPSQRAKLIADDPYNVVKITLGPNPMESDWYDQASAIKDRWLAEAILARDTAPVLYGYRQYFRLPTGETHVRTGFVGRVRLGEWGEGIHRHEHTRLGPRADRLCLTRAMRANMSPVFGLYRDPGNDVVPYLAPPTHPLVDTLDPDDVRHIFWRIEAPDAIQAISQLMIDRDVIIADGHHRYETALAYRAERRQAEDDPQAIQPYDHVMMYLTSVDYSGLDILATHRVVSGKALDEQMLLARLGEDFVVSSHEGDGTLTAAIGDLAEQGHIAMGLILPQNKRWVLRLRSRERAIEAATNTPTALATLDVLVLQNLVMAPHLGITSQILADSERVSYTIHESEAAHQVASLEAQAAFIINPTSLDQVWQAASHGLTMPQKSTYFYPKLLTGLVFNPLD